MTVMEWTVEQILQDSECCGNPLRCHSEALSERNVFRSCVGVVEEEVL
jgi:hypothetical protein